MGSSVGSLEASRNTKNKIVRYYDDTFLDYFLVLRLWQHLGMHYGFYDQAKKQSLKDAILNMNRVVADKARVEPEMKVLDAGCGVGGSSIWLAKNRGAEVTGITLVENQRVKAEKLAKKYGVSNKTSFLVRDYFKTGFADIMPFSQWLYRRSVVAYPIAKILEWIRIRSKVGTGNVRASIFQNKTLNKGLWAYVIYTAQK